MIKEIIQRAYKGYSDSDLAHPDEWFENLILSVAEQLGIDDKVKYNFKMADQKNPYEEEFKNTVSPSPIDDKFFEAQIQINENRRKRIKEGVCAFIDEIF